MKSRVEKNHDKTIVEQVNNKKDKQQLTNVTDDTPQMSDEDKIQIQKLYEQYVRDSDVIDNQKTPKKQNINLFLNRGIIILSLLLIIILIIAFFF